MFGNDNSLYAKKRPLSEFIQFVTSGGRGWAKYYADNGTRFIRSLDVQMGYIGAEDVAYVQPPASAEARRTLVQDRDVLLTITGSRIGRVACLPIGFGLAHVSQHVAIIRLDQEKIVPEFVAFYLSMANGGQLLIANSQYGQTKPGLNFEQIGRFEIPVPTMEHQLAFLNALSRLGAKSKCSELASEKMDSLFTSLQHRAFRGEL
jgi:type I restriction enzyme S subunit